MMSYEVLSAKYDGFKAPVVRVASGRNIFTLALSSLLGGTALGIQTDNVSVTLNRNAASSASITITNAYNSLVRTFLDKVTVGSKIVVSMGYGSLIKNVFSGFVETVSYDFSDKPSVKITAFDAVRIMLERGTRKKVWKPGGLYQADFLEIMSDYSEVCGISAKDMQPTAKTHGMLVQNTNDYDYIKNSLCKFCDRDFIVVGGKANFINPYTPSSKITDLGYGRGLVSFSMTPAYKKVTVVVSGDRIKNVSANSTVKTGEKYISALDKPLEIFKDNMPFTTAADCKLYADRVAFDEVSSAQIALGSCIGLPDLVPGKTIGIIGVDLRWSTRKFVLESVTHNMSSSGYSTSFSIKGWY